MIPKFLLKWFESFYPKQTPTPKTPVLLTLEGGGGGGGGAMETTWGPYGGSGGGGGQPVAIPPSLYTLEQVEVEELDQCRRKRNH